MSVSLAMKVVNSAKFIKSFVRIFRISSELFNNPD